MTDKSKVSVVQVRCGICTGLIGFCEKSKLNELALKRLEEQKALICHKCRNTEGYLF